MDAKLALIEAGLYLQNNRLAWGTSGNMSVRLDDEQMLLTASGTKIGELSADDLIVSNIYTGAYTGERKASKETPMHSGIYKKRADVKAVIHSSPFYTTFLSCTNENIQSNLFIETMYYLENIAYVEYFHPGTAELGEAIAQKACEVNIIMMKNHGVVVFDESLEEAKMRLETLEMACRMMVEAKASGIPLVGLSEDTVQSFLNESLYKPRKK
ncbi:class II aldolase/adducin family protein [Psychrobacillus sp. NPDC093180]|uniref:class II aldolase/adducin family protein n=1 Tax=Psychrobacillus sp. NPDC093180 TaxID=3364489 RepID=UPI003823477D